MFRVLLGAILSATILMVWGFVFWVVLPLPHQVIRGIPQESTVIANLETNITESGVYNYPHQEEVEGSETEKKAAKDQFNDKCKKGPIVWLVYVNEGFDPKGYLVYVLGWIHFFVSALIVAWLLAMASGGLSSISSRMFFVIVIGLFVGVFAQGSYIIWWHFPTMFPITTALFQLAGWTLVSPVLALIVKKRPAVA